MKFSEIPSFVINLERCPGRMEAMSRQLNELGLPWERFEAYDGRKCPLGWCQLNGFNIDRKTTDGKAYGPRSDQLSNGQRGSALSYISVLRLIVERDLPYAIIYEDDCIFCDNYVELAQKYLDETPICFDIALIGNQLDDDEGVEPGVKLGPSFCLHAALWTKRAAQRFLNKISDYGLTVIDIMLVETIWNKELICFYWYKGLSDEERAKYKLYKNRSTGLVYQSLEYVSTIND